MAFQESRWFGVLIRVVVPGALFLGLLIWCVYEFTDSAADDTRNEKVHEFNHAVDEWRAFGREAFAAIGNVHAEFQMPVTVAPSGTTLEPNSVGPTPLDHSQDVERFDGLFYKGMVDVELPGGWADAIGDVIFLVGASNHSIRIKDVEVTKTEIIHTTNWKVCENAHRGTLNAKESICSVRRILRKLCITVHNTTGLFEIKGGCSSKGFTPTPNPIFDVRPGPRYWNPTYLTEKVAFSVEVELRSAGDPYLTSLSLSGGNHTFGQSRGERLKLAWVLFGLCLFFFLFALLVAYVNRRCGKKIEKEAQELYPIGVRGGSDFDGTSARPRTKKAKYQVTRFTGLEATDSFGSSEGTSAGGCAVPSRPPIPPPIAYSVGQHICEDPNANAASTSSKDSTLGADTVSIELQQKVEVAERV